MNRIGPVGWAGVSLMGLATWACAEPSRPYPLWDGKATQAEYARRVGLSPELTLDLGGGTTLRCVLIPAGRFFRGGPERQQEVIITRPFFISATEVTQAQYEQVMGSNPSRGGQSPDLPVHDVTWEEAAEFCRRLSQRAGRAIALPTEAQWEHAYRAGTTTVYFSGDDEASMLDYAWFAKNSPIHHGPNAGPLPVATKKPNPWGLYDMAGNLNEWCRDFFDPAADANEPVVADPTGPSTGKTRVIKGGSVMQVSWIKPDFRRGVAPNYRFGMEASPMIIGFRVVAGLDEDARPATQSGLEGAGTAPKRRSEP